MLHIRDVVIIDGSSCEMSNLVTRLRALKLELSDEIIMHLVLISLHAQFSP